MVATLLKDLAYAVRLAMRRPALTAVTILTLALGIGGTIALLILASIAAAYAPARRVLRIDPAATLRS